MSSPSPIRVSILGTGSSLRTFHYPSVSQLPGKFVLHSVLERTDRGVARDVCGSEIKVVNSLNAVLSDSEVDLVRSRLLSRSLGS
jgi:predicted dehydrogenase